MILGASCDPIQPSSCTTHPLSRPIHRLIRLLEQVGMQIEFRPDRAREVGLAVNRVREDGQAGVLVWA